MRNLLVVLFTGVLLVSTLAAQADCPGVSMAPGGDAASVAKLESGLSNSTVQNGVFIKEIDIRAWRYSNYGLADTQECNWKWRFAPAAYNHFVSRDTLNEAQEAGATSIKYTYYRMKATEDKYGNSTGETKITVLILSVSVSELSKVNFDKFHWPDQIEAWAKGFVTVVQQRKSNL